MDAVPEHRELRPSPPHPTAQASLELEATLRPEIAAAKLVALGTGTRAAVLFYGAVVLVVVALAVVLWLGFGRGPRLRLLLNVRALLEPIGPEEISVARALAEGGGGTT